MIKTYIPKLDDLWFRELMLSDESTMSYNHAYGGVISFPKSSWNNWYDYWISNHDNKRFYRYLVNDHNEFIGEIAYHFESDKCMIDILVYGKYRGNGYGSYGLNLLLKEIKERKIEEVYDTIAFDNKSINLFLNNGFEIIDRNSETITVRKIL